MVPSVSPDFTVHHLLIVAVKKINRWQLALSLYNASATRNGLKYFLNFENTEILNSQNISRAKMPVFNKSSNR